MSTARCAIRREARAGRRSICNFTRHWPGPVCFVHELVAERLGAGIAEHEIYFAGPPPMALAVQKVLFDLKVPFGQIHFDQFY